MILPAAPATDRLLAGPRLREGPESFASHSARLGDLPDAAAVRELIPALEASGLLGRGGAGFPVGRKWRALAERRDGRAVVVANGAEGEPASAKDRTLMTARPHLVVDGAVLAAEAVGADAIVFYVGGEHTAAITAMRRAIAERRSPTGIPMRVVAAPTGYVAGEATAAVHYIDSADARPTATPPRMSEQGVGGHPTLVQNVESLACAALIARYGEGWYRSAGRLETPGTALVTVTGAARAQGVREIELGTTLAGIVAEAGGLTEAVEAVVLGGYFGTWVRVRDAWDLPLDPVSLKASGLTFGCGIVGLLPARACGVAATAEIMAFMAGESAGQCGPCVHGLRAIADATSRIARGSGGAADTDDIERWVGLVAGRGACRHPDGAAQLMASALVVFWDDFHAHARTGACAAHGRPLEVA